MSSPDKHINTWSMTDVRKYLAGELSAREMHDLEKAALDDPFLTDALEGLATRANPAAPGNEAQPSALDHDLTELRARLDARVNVKKKRSVIPLWMRVAAAVILLAGLGSTVYYLQQGKSKLNVDIGPEPATVAKSAPPPASTAPASPAEPPAKTATPPAESEKAPTTLSTPPTASARQPAVPTTATPPGASATQPASPADKASTQPAAAPVALSRAESKTSDSLTYTNNNRRSGSNPASAAELRAVRLDTTAAADGYVAGYGTKKRTDDETFKRVRERFDDHASLVFSGRVLDAGNRPLAGASVYLRGSKNGFLTDGEGKFNVYVAPQDTARMVTVAKLGYEQTSYALNTAALKDNIIRLQEYKSTLNEVVVTGVGQKRKETLAAPPSDEKEDLDSFWIKTSPVVGRQAYLEYLASAKKGLTIDTTIRGLESISFIVDHHGEYTDFKIERSLSPSHDAGLIRLIMEGPAWKPLRRKKVRAVVTVSFP